MRGTRTTRRWRYAAWLAAALAFTSGPATAQTGTLDVTLTNGTTGQPGDAAEVVLMHLSGGMNVVASQADVVGAATFTGIESPDDGPFLVQAKRDDITYSEQVQFTGGRATVHITVYDVTDTPDNIRVSVPPTGFIFRRADNTLIIDRTWDVINTSDPPRAWLSEAGSFRFFLPERHELMHLTVQSGTMPINQGIMPTEDPEVGTLYYAMKPGTTQIQLRYRVPYDDERFAYREPMLYDLDDIIAIVSPADITVASQVLEPGDGVGSREFQMYRASAIRAGTMLDLDLSGGSRAAAIAADGEDPHDHGGGGDGRRIVTVPGMSFDRIAILMGLLSILLVLGTWTGEIRHAAGKHGPKVDRHTANQRKQGLFTSIARLDDRFSAKEISPREYNERRLEMKSELVRLMKTLEAAG